LTLMGFMPQENDYKNYGKNEIKIYRDWANQYKGWSQAEYAIFLFMAMIMVCLISSVADQKDNPAKAWHAKRFMCPAVLFLLASW